MNLQFRRPDGTFVALIGAHPYHVTEDDPLFGEASVAAAEMGDALPFEPPPEPVIVDIPPSASVVALAELGVENGEVTGIESACGIGFAIMIDVGVFWLFFTTPQPDNKYLPFVQSPEFETDLRVTAREADYLEVSARGRATGEPTIPAGFAITVQRTQ